MSVGNPTKTKEEFGWMAQTKLEDGLKAVYVQGLTRISRLLARVGKGV
jgi:hypothetical protein